MCRRGMDCRQSGDQPTTEPVVLDLGRGEGQVSGVEKWESSRSARDPRRIRLRGLAGGLARYFERR
jgi:hypothetical protein